MINIATNTVGGAAGGSETGGKGGGSNGNNGGAGGTSQIGTSGQGGSAAASGEITGARAVTLGVHAVAGGSGNGYGLQPAARSPRQRLIPTCSDPDL